MKTKLLIVLMILTLMVSIVGCSSEEPTKSTDDINETTNVEETEVNEDVDTDEENKTVETDIKPLDTSLEGIDLINSLSSEKPKSMMIKTEVTAFGMATISTAYYDGENFRTETDVQGLGTTVLISNAKDGAMYSYTEGQSQGVKIIDADTDFAEEMGLMMDMGSKFSAIIDASSEDIIARVEKLDGEEVIYIEATEADEEMGEVDVFMWYSTKYCTPLKYEIVLGEQPMLTLKVVEIEKNINIDKDMFYPPSDVAFEDVDMDSMFDMMDE